LTVTPPVLSPIARHHFAADHFFSPNGIAQQRRGLPEL
jgi:hypothetical protein